jgi:hypothetical protein
MPGPVITSCGPQQRIRFLAGQPAHPAFRLTLLAVHRRVGNAPAPFTIGVVDGG